MLRHRHLPALLPQQEYSWTVSACGRDLRPYEHCRGYEEFGLISAGFKQTPNSDMTEKWQEGPSQATRSTFVSVSVLVTAIGDKGSQGLHFPAHWDLPSRNTHKTPSMHHLHTMKTKTYLATGSESSTSLPTSTKFLSIQCTLWLVFRPAWESRCHMMYPFLSASSASSWLGWDSAVPLLDLW